MRKAFLFILLFFSVWCSALIAQGNPSSDHVTLPWDEFNSLSNPGKDEIILTLEVFEKLAALTDSRLQPQKRQGYVILTRQELSKLVDAIPSSPDRLPDPPVDYLISRSSYLGKMKTENTVFEADLVLHVLKDNVFVYVPVLPANLALEKVTVDNKSAVLTERNGYHCVLLQSAGDYSIQLRFSVKSSLEQGPQKLDIAIVKTPITLLELEIPKSALDVVVPQAQQVSTTSLANATKIQAIISSGNNMSIRWRKKLDEQEKLPAKLYAELFHLISIEDDALSGRSVVNLNILHNELDGVSFTVPESLNILSVQGEGVGEWQEKYLNGKKILIVPFTYGKKGETRFEIRIEQAMNVESKILSFSGLEVKDAVRETGNIGIELNSSAEVNVKSSQGVEPMPVQKLPDFLRQSSDKPLFLGFKYLKHPFYIELEVEKHKKIPVPSAAVYSSNAVTLFTEDGKIVHRLLYQIRNSSKQFMQLSLPKGAMVWSVFVDNKPVESSVNDKEQLLVPLVRSASENNKLQTFPVEVIYCIVDSPFKGFDRLKTALPAIDLINSQMMWSVYLPNTYSYLGFKSSLEKENLIRGLYVFTNKRRYNEQAVKDAVSPKISGETLREVYKGKSYKSEFKNAPVDEAQVQSQVEAEMGFSGRLEEMQTRQMPQASVPSTGGAVGVLPLQIHIPTSGQIYRFAKTIIMPQDSLYVEVTYTGQAATKLIKWILILAFAAVVFLLRRRFIVVRRILKKGFLNFSAWIKQHKSNLLIFYDSPLSPFIWLALAVLGLFIAPFFTVLFALLCILVVLNRHFRKRAARQSKK